LYLPDAAWVDNRDRIGARATCEESGDAASVTTVTFEERDGKTLLVMR